MPPLGIDYYLATSALVRGVVQRGKKKTVNGGSQEMRWGEIKRDLFEEFLSPLMILFIANGIRGDGTPELH